MAMPYRDLLEVVRQRGFDQLVRVQVEGYDLRLIGRGPVVIPFAFKSFPLLLENGDETEVEDEEIAALMRWIDKQQGQPCRSH